MKERPDPDDLLQHVQAEEKRAQRGRLKIFFGASAGVGKTYVMLAAAREAQLTATPSSSAWSRRTVAPRLRPWLTVFRALR